MQPLMTKGAQVDGVSREPFAKTLMEHLWSVSPPRADEPWVLAMYHRDPSSPDNKIIFLVPSDFAPDFGPDFTRHSSGFKTYIKWHAGADKPVNTFSSTKCLQLFGPAWCQQNDTTRDAFPDYISRYESGKERDARTAKRQAADPAAAGPSRGSPVARLS